MATVDFMEKVIRNTPAVCDQEHIPMIVCSVPQVPDRTAAIFGQGADPLPAMLDGLARLERAGVTCVAITCNAAHHWHAALQAAASVPILHIVDASVEALAGKGIRSGAIGLLAGSGTLQVGVYEKRFAQHGFVCITPDAAGQAEVMRAIYLVKANEFDEPAAILQRHAEALVAKGCRQVAMACTEIPVVLARVSADLQQLLLDPTEALALAAIRACLPAASLRPSEPLATA
jgi:aspartate racemase